MSPSQARSSWLVIICRSLLTTHAGSDLSRHSELNTVFAGFHYDLNMLTIHGRSRYPGLFAWLREGRRFPVRIPQGCLLIQAGAQMEWLTGGAVKAGYHEVRIAGPC
jgi:isopenicillin N synthase-like dioxygenase